MAAGLGFKTFTSGEVLTAADTNGYLMQGINVFANASARTAAITSPQEGQYSYLKDTNALEYYDGAAWVGAPVGDITAVTAGTGISGGGSSGDVTITNSMATTIDAKGDLIAGTADNAFARLAVGNNGETLVADSSASTGLRWAATPSASNPVLNSAAQIGQRGTSMAGGTSASTGFCADRWQATRGGYTAGQTASRQVTGDTTNLPFIQYCIRVQRDLGNTNTATSNLSQSMESMNSIPYAGRTVTLSFYARAGANYSATSNALTYRLDTGTGTDQNLINGYTGGAATVSATATLTTTWQRFQATATLPTTTTEFGVLFQETPTGTASTNDYYEVTGVQIDIGSVALPFRTYAATIQGELSACQRYYYRKTVPSIYTVIDIGWSQSATGFKVVTTFPVTMRTAPTGIDQSGTAANYGVFQGSAGLTCSAVPSFENATTANAQTNFPVSSGLTTGQGGAGRSDNSTAAFLGWSAEL